MWGNGFPAMRFCTVFPDRCESRAFFRPAARRQDGLLFLAAFAAFGIFGVAVLVEGGRQSRKAGQRRILSLSILLVLITGFFLLMDYREYAMLRQVTALLGGAA